MQSGLLAWLAGFGDIARRSAIPWRGINPSQLRHAECARGATNHRLIRDISRSQEKRAWSQGLARQFALNRPNDRATCRASQA